MVMLTVLKVIVKCLREFGSQFLSIWLSALITVKSGPYVLGLFRRGRGLQTTFWKLLLKLLLL